MLNKIEIKNYRRLFDVQSNLGNLSVIIGANGTGKSTFLDSFQFIQQIINDGLSKAIATRTHDANHIDPITSGFQGGPIEFSFIFQLPEAITHQIDTSEEKGFFRQAEYTIVISHNLEINKPAIQSEHLHLIPEHGMHRVSFNKTKLAKANYIPETKPKQGDGKGWQINFPIGRSRSLLPYLPELNENELQFPAAQWVYEYLSQGIQYINLNPQQIKKKLFYGDRSKLEPDGENLVILVEKLRQREENHHGKFNQTPFTDWLAHLQVGIPDLRDIQIVKDEDTNAKYFKIQYAGSSDHWVPSWLISDGTLRFLALTILAYDEDTRGIYMIEEPEIGLHPKLIELLMQSLSSCYHAQILLTTHSPLVIDQVTPEQVQYFLLNNEGKTKIYPGHQHPKMQDWQGMVPFSDYFASGILD